MPSVAIDSVTVTSCDTVPLITDTLTLMLPASSRTEYEVESKPSVTSTGERVAHSISVMQSRTKSQTAASVYYVTHSVFPLPQYPTLKVPIKVGQP